MSFLRFPTVRYTHDAIYPQSNHSKMSKRLHNRIFLLRCTLWLSCILRFRQIKVLTDIQSTLLLNLCDIQ